MSDLLDNYGLDFFLEDDDTFMGLTAYILKNGKALGGYYGTPYFFKSMGNVEFWVGTERNEKGTLSVSGVNVHCGGNCVWDVIHTGIDVTVPENGNRTRRIMVKRKADDAGLVIINLINADVLPSLMRNDEIRAQVVAQPLNIEYYASDEAYEAAQSEGEDGQKWMVGEGSLLPADFLYNHSLERYEEGKNYESDQYIYFRATVTRLYYGTFEMEGNKSNTFIRCFADTSYGELEFDHTYEQVPEEMRCNIKIGSVISGICILSGDVAIEEYGNGAIKDFDHDLRLLRYTFENGEAERLRSVLAEDATYETDTSGKTYSGSDEIIEKIDYVNKNADTKYFAHLAVITDPDGLDYPVGTRCIVLASGSEDDYESVVFVTVNEDGMITHIKVCTDSRYHFEIVS